MRTKEERFDVFLTKWATFGLAVLGFILGVWLVLDYFAW